MNRSDFLLVTGASALTSPSGSTDSNLQISGGSTYFPAFADAPFPHGSRAAGHDYQGKHYDAATHYADATVGIFVPDHFRADKTTDFIVHFHGWNNDVRTVLQRYRLREQLLASARNAVLLVPQGPKDVPDSGDGKLELDADGFHRFVSEATAWLRAHRIVPPNSDVGRIVVSAHSGGYGGAGGAIARGGLSDAISDVLLFDSAYGYFAAFADWAKASPSHHLLSLFTDDTSTGNAAVMGLVQAPQPNLYVRLADSMTLDMLQTRAPTFVLTTSVAHDELLQRHDWYALFLQTTALASIPSGS